ncbi:hypothetical protein [Nocardia sp. NPDC057668]|uniref:hypothetical protein n=1 Tax=Nocardia sp. NPDC057668 TaxID=3346202 RepID=UPI00366D1177
MSESAYEVEQARHEPSGIQFEKLRRGLIPWTALGLVLAVTVGLVGGALTGLFGVWRYGALGVSPLASVPGTVYIPLLVAPLAAGVGVAVTFAGLLAKAAPFRRPDRGELIVSSCGAAILGSAMGALFSLAGSMAGELSAMVTIRLVGTDVSAEVYDHYLTMFENPAHADWSLAESVMLAVMVILALGAARWWRDPAPSLTPARRSLLWAAAPIVVLGVLYGIIAALAYWNLAESFTIGPDNSYTRWTTR